MRLSILKITSLIVVILFLLPSFSFSDHHAAEQANLKKLRSKLKETGFYGAVLIAKEGEIIFKEAYGNANEEFDIPNTSDTVFRLGSITKQFTSTAVMQLVEKGLVKLGDTFSKYWPGYPNGEKFTIHQLLTHTAGINCFTRSPEYQKIMVKPLDIKGVINIFKNKPLDFKPGSRYKYSNSGYILLGYLVEAVSGMKYDKYIKKNILEPAGLKRTGYDHNWSIIKKRAAGYFKKDKQLYNCMYINMEIPHGAGAMYSTVEDLYKWDQALYAEKILSRRSLEKMFTPEKRGYGYGWMISKKNGIIEHGGSINGFRSLISRKPSTKSTVILLCNVINSDLRPIVRALKNIAFE